VVAEGIFEIIKTYTDTVYFVPGGGAMYLVDALGKSGLKYVSALHEQGAGFMACGHAMYTNKLGVCLVTSGPGATNAVTPCLAAWMDSIPVLFISGQVPSNVMIGNTGLRSRGGQEVDIINLIRPITKQAVLLRKDMNYMLETRSSIGYCLSNRRGPAWMDVPLDVQSMVIHE
jgi:acetolactate synthase-1/2/3 large subunit